MRRRAAVLAALGDPARLAVVDALGDRSPGELGDLAGLPSNLLAHHLRLLERAGLVERRRSEADRRRTYVRLVLAALPAPIAPTVAAPRVVFVCTHNSARSQLASALWARRSKVPVASAGTHPALRISRGAVAVARRHGVSLGTGTAGVAEVLRSDDLVVAVCDRAHEELGGALHWSVPDPVPVGTPAAFERAYEEIEERVDRLAGATGSSTTRPAGASTRSGRSGTRSNGGSVRCWPGWASSGKPEGQVRAAQKVIVAAAAVTPQRTRAVV